METIPYNSNFNVFQFYIFHNSEYYDMGVDILKNSLSEITANPVWRIQEPGISAVQFAEEVIRAMESTDGTDTESYTLFLCSQFVEVLKCSGPSSTKKEDKKDITNLSKAFGVSSIQRHPNDQDSVAAWIREWQSKGKNNPILFSKLQSASLEGFKDEDFLIVIQTEFQKALLQKLGQNGLCGDGTHGTNEYDFLLTTILVIVEYGEGQPVAWMISNQETFEFLQVFFSKRSKMQQATYNLNGL